MIHATFKQKLDSSGNIPGIYNYCNRFCEDCPFTEVCATYKMSAARFASKENPEDFSRALQESMESARMMLEKLINRSDFDPDDYDEDPDEIAWQQKIDDAVDNHRLAITAMEYFDMVSSVFDKLDKISLPNESMEMDLQKIVAFSSHILTKMKRALHGFYEMDPFDEDDFDVYDMNGSAKCLLVMVDDSVTCWKKVLEAAPEVKSDVSGPISLLEILRKATEIQFPDARAFIRGGFDEM